MIWSNFFHIYQPRNQQADVLEAVVAQSYRPLFLGLTKIPQARITLNVTGALLELFDHHGYGNLIDALAKLGKLGIVEFTSSAKYHAFLPMLSESEIVRQITENNQTLKFYLGRDLKLAGFFPPEMAYDPKLCAIVEDLGFKWLILDEIALSGKAGLVDYNAVYKTQSDNLMFFFRQRQLSNLIMSSAIRSQHVLQTTLKDLSHDHKYIITGMDGETFGHHRVGLDRFLLEALANPKNQLATLSELASQLSDCPVIICEPVRSTWASSEADIAAGNQFLSWADPANEIHRFQKDFVNFVLRTFAKVKPSVTNYQILRTKLDIAQASDHFFWASAKPWWSLEMIVDGAYQLLDIILNIENCSPKTVNQARFYYERVVSTALFWKNSDKMTSMIQSQKAISKIPFKNRTLESDTEEIAVYEAFITMLKHEERKAARDRQYEAAVLWRDAVYKLENKLDIYDAINVIDLFRLKMQNDKIEKVIAKYRAHYQKMRGGQPEQRG